MHYPATESVSPELLPEDPARDFSANRRLLVLSVMAVVVGFFGALAAWVLQGAIALATNIAYFGRFSAAPVAISANHLGHAAALVPVAGCLIIGLMARYGSEKIRGHGIPEAIEAILIGKSRIQPKVALLKPLSSAISIGTGGPFGAEGPIIMTGGALGSIFAQMFHLSSAERKTLLVAGAAAGMSATFNSPVAAMLLAVELLLFEWKPRSFIPVSIAAMVAAALRPLVLPAGPLFPVPAPPDLPDWALVFCAGLGVAAGLFSGLLTQLVYKCEDAFAKLPIHWMWWPALGGLAIGLGGLLEPRALGVGYDNIAALLQGQLTGVEAWRLIGVKAAIWAIALGSGTSGGVLAPLLMMGGALGAGLSPYVHCGTPGFWALIGMAAVMGGTMRAPLTAVVFAIELTHEPGVLLPLAAACVAAQATTVLLLKRSILTEKIARRGHHVFREYVVDPFETVRVGEIMATDVEVLPDTLPLVEAAEFFARETPERQHRYYPVVDGNGKPCGVVCRADILKWMMEESDLKGALGARVARQAPVTARAHELAGRLADRMVQADAGCALVLEPQGRAVAGIVTRGDLLRVRAHFVRNEHERETLMPVRRRRATRRRPKG